MIQTPGETHGTEQWLRVRTVSRRLDVHFRTVHRWIEQGRFGRGAAMRLPGGHWRVRESAIKQFEPRDL